MTYIYSWICCCWPTFSRSFENHVWISTVLIHYIIILLRVLHGMLLFVCHVYIYNLSPMKTCIILSRTNIYIKPPNYVGFTLLEQSKLHMYDFHCNHMKMKYPHAYQLRLLFTGTDSLAYAVQTENIYKDVSSDPDQIRSRYYIWFQRVSPPYDESNRKALGFFKDELNSVPMQEFVGLRPKCYAFLCAGKVDRNAVQHDKTRGRKLRKV